MQRPLAEQVSGPCLHPDAAVEMPLCSFCRRLSPVRTAPLMKWKGKCHSVSDWHFPVATAALDGPSCIEHGFSPPSAAAGSLDISLPLPLCFSRRHWRRTTAAGDGYWLPSVLRLRPARLLVPVVSASCVFTGDSRRRPGTQGCVPQQGGRFHSANHGVTKSVEPPR